ncbi:MAG TPA: response regulator transcription factor [Bryobacteraceae bacterium]|nr:response regulator transcription factor [Bryobacteraceae bacterium]
MTDVMLVDDHKIMRDGLKAILRPHHSFRVVGEAASGAEAVQMARALQPHVIVMDLSLPGLNGIEATAEILRHLPDTRIIILSMYDDDSSVMEAMRAGARAFVIKNASDEDLIQALGTVARGGSYLSPLISDRFLSHLRKGDIDQVRPSQEIDRLSPRERQVMRLVAEGKSSKEIAALLELGVETVRGYRKTLMKKLGVSNVAELAQIAFRCGLAGGTSRATAAGSSD